MKRVLEARADDCFDDSASYCGNGIAEAGEVCDCGTKCAEDPCCTTNCTIPAGQDCSPQNPLLFPCCTAECKFVVAQAQKTCLAGTDCAKSAVCSGTSATCPKPETRPDLTPCECLENDCNAYPDTASRICTDGLCRLSLCALYNATRCSLMGDLACQLACVGPSWGDGKTCISSADIKNRPANISVAISLPPGATCMK
jgi:hypothetical protein